MSSEFVQAIEALGKEKGINSDILFQAVEEVSFTFLNSAESWNR